MKLVIFGATGKTGNEILKQSLLRGDEVTAFVRDPLKIDVKNASLKVIEGDIFQIGSVTQAIQGQDAVVCALGSSDLSRTSVRSDGTKNIIKAMEDNNVLRLVVVSAMGVGESWSTLSNINKLFFATVLRSAREDHETQETFVKESKLDWTIIRPSGLTDTPLTKSYSIGENILAETSRISRADVAHAILNELMDNEFLRKAVTITQ